MKVYDFKLSKSVMVFTAEVFTLFRISLCKRPLKGYKLCRVLRNKHIFDETEGPWKEIAFLRKYGSENLNLFFFFFALLWVTYMKLLLCGWRDLLDFIYFYRTSVILALPVQTICLINLKCSWTLLPLQINLCWALRKQVSV